MDTNYSVPFLFFVKILTAKFPKKKKFTLFISFNFGYFRKLQNRDINIFKNYPMLKER